MSFKDIKKLLASKGTFSHSWSNSVLSLTQLGRTSTAQYFFEFSFFLKITTDVVVALPGNWKVELPVNLPVGKTVYVWPLAPGLPDNFSFVSGVVNGLDIEIRPGVNAQVPAHAMTVSPDVSIRIPNAASAIENSVVRMWDAKYRSKLNNRITRLEILAFALENQYLIDPVEKVIFDGECGGLLAAVPKRSGLLQHSSLITNGMGSTEPVTLLKKEGIGETEYFDTASEAHRGA